MPQAIVLPDDLTIHGADMAQVPEVTPDPTTLANDGLAESKKLAFRDWQATLVYDAKGNLASGPGTSAAADAFQVADEKLCESLQVSRF